MAGFFLASDGLSFAMYIDKKKEFDYNYNCKYNIVGIIFYSPFISITKLILIFCDTIKSRKYIEEG